MLLQIYKERFAEEQRMYALVFRIHALLLSMECHFICVVDQILAVLDVLQIFFVHKVFGACSFLLCTIIA